MLVQEQERSQSLPWIVLAGAGWLAMTCASLRFLPTYFCKNVALVGSPAVAAVVVACLPQSVLKRTLMRFLKKWVTCFLLYNLVVVLSALLFLLGCSTAGYLPYSDRPGPGWGIVPVHLPKLQEIGYFGGWSLLLFPTCVLWGSSFFFFVAWVGWFGTPKWLIRVLGALFCGVLTLFMTAAIGWYIAIAAFPVYGTGLAGLLFGALILPRFSESSADEIALWKRAVLVSGPAVAIAAVITYPFWRG